MRARMLITNYYYYFLQLFQIMPEYRIEIKYGNQYKVLCFATRVYFNSIACVVGFRFIRKLNWRAASAYRNLQTFIVFLRVLCANFVSASVHWTDGAFSCILSWFIGLFIIMVGFDGNSAYMLQLKDRLDDDDKCTWSIRTIHWLYSRIVAVSLWWVNHERSMKPCMSHVCMSVWRFRFFKFVHFFSESRLKNVFSVAVHWFIANRIDWFCSWINLIFEPAPPVLQDKFFSLV